MGQRIIFLPTLSFAQLYGPANLELAHSQHTMDWAHANIGWCSVYRTGQLHMRFRDVCYGPGHKSARSFVNQFSFIGGWFHPSGRSRGRLTRIPAIFELTSALISTTFAPRHLTRPHPPSYLARSHAPRSLPPSRTPHSLPRTSLAPTHAVLPSRTRHTASHHL